MDSVPLDVGDAPQASGAHVGRSTSDSVPVRKKKRSEMGPQERKLMRKAADERATKLTEDVDDMLDEIDELYLKVAESNSVSVQRVKDLARRLPSIKPQKKASNYNVLLHFKTQELNGGKLIMLYSSCSD